MQIIISRAQWHRYLVDLMQKDMLKNLAVVFLAVLVLLLFYHFYGQGQQIQFVPAKTISATNFTGVFNSASNIFILMDVRGISNSTVKTNVLQCGVDFAASNAMGGKNVTYLSISEDGCTSIEGKKPADYCFSNLDKGITIYVKEGNSTSFYSNGIIVGINSTYSIGSCGIRRSVVQ